MKWPPETRSEFVSESQNAHAIGMNDNPRTITTDGPAKAQPGALSARFRLRSAVRTMSATRSAASASAAGALMPALAPARSLLWRHQQGVRLLRRLVERVLRLRLAEEHGRDRLTERVDDPRPLRQRRHRLFRVREVVRHGADPRELVE